MLGDVVIVVIFWMLFLGWLLYLAAIKKDLKPHKHAISTAAFFLGVMTFVYWLILA